MYKFVSEKEVQKYREYCDGILQRTCISLTSKGILAYYELVGSGSRDLVTRNGNGPFDLDYNLVIWGSPATFRNNFPALKETIRVSLNNELAYTAFKDSKNSTSVLTTIVNHPQTTALIFSFDLAIIIKNKDGNYCRLINNKCKSADGKDLYNLCEIPTSNNLKEKISLIKSHGEWEKYKPYYLERKNKYLLEKDTSHSSYVVLEETVNEFYDKIFGKIVKNNQTSHTGAAKTPSNIQATNQNRKQKIPQINSNVQKVLSKAGNYTNEEISRIASIVCQHYKKYGAEKFSSALFLGFGRRRSVAIFYEITDIIK